MAKKSVPIFHLCISRVHVHTLYFSHLFSYLAHLLLVLEVRLPQICHNESCRQRELLFNNLPWIYSNILAGEAGYFLTGSDLWYIPLLALSPTVVNKAKGELTDLNKLHCSNSFDAQTTMKVSHFLDNGTAAKFSFYPLCSFGFC